MGVFADRGEDGFGGAGGDAVAEAVVAGGSVAAGLASCSTVAVLVARHGAEAAASSAGHGGQPQAVEHAGRELRRGEGEPEARDGWGE